MISLKNCSLYLKNHENILEDISLEISNFEKVSIYGDNGSGKSTLLKMIGKKIYPTTGTLINNQKLSFLSYGDNFTANLTGRENVYFSLLLSGRTKAYIDKHISSIERIIDIGNFFDTPIYRYSRGMKQRIKFVTAMHINCGLLLVDEALKGGVDRNFKKIADAMLEDYIKSKTLILISHDINEILKFTNKYIFLKDGKIECISHDQKKVKNYFLNV